MDSCIFLNSTEYQAVMVPGWKVAILSKPMTV